MLTVTCPFCQEKGRIPDDFIGKRIKCAKCNNRFQVTPPVPKGSALKAAKVEAPIAEPAGPVHQGIEIEGIEDATWAPPVAASVAESKGEAEGAHGVFTESRSDQPTDIKQYKVLTQKD